MYTLAIATTTDFELPETHYATLADALVAVRRAAEVLGDDLVGVVLERLDDKGANLGRPCPGVLPCPTLTP